MFLTFCPAPALSKLFFQKKKEKDLANHVSFAILDYPQLRMIDCRTKEWMLFLFLFPFLFFISLSTLSSAHRDKETVR
jgi:hypothetical protein